MKLALLVALIAIASCTKTKTVTVTVPVHDTTIVTVIDTTYIHAALLGGWISSTSKTVAFSHDSLFWDGSYSYKYAASHDTIYHIFSYKNIVPVFSYTVTGTTLLLTQVTPYYTSYTFNRN